MKNIHLRFKNVSAAMKRTLKRRENPASAATQIQYQRSSVNRPLSARRVFPTVPSLVLTVCTKEITMILANLIECRLKFIKSSSSSFFKGNKLYIPIQLYGVN